RVELQIQHLENIFIRQENHLSAANYSTSVQIKKAPTLVGAGEIFLIGGNSELMNGAVINVDIGFCAQERFKNFVGAGIDSLDVHAGRVNFEGDFDWRIARGFWRQIYNEFAEEFDVIGGVGS
ncbi:hypothetical protein DCD76_19060, partial [Acinetobacter baumannii]|uniref:hypothetical protein n=1 Tax=Acinetobacter baumannii TaxID=470 RepID=UPI000DE6A29C